MAAFFTFVSKQANSWSLTLPNNQQRLITLRQSGCHCSCIPRRIAALHCDVWPTAGVPPVTVATPACCARQAAPGYGRALKGRREPATCIVMIIGCLESPRARKPAGVAMLYCCTASCAAVRATSADGMQISRQSIGDEDQRGTAAASKHAELAWRQWSRGVIRTEAGWRSSSGTHRIMAKASKQAVLLLLLLLASPRARRDSSIAACPKSGQQEGREGVRDPPSVMRGWQATLRS